MYNFKFLDLFSGIGGFRLAFESLNGKSIGFSEIDKLAIQVYKMNYNILNEIEFGDISKINIKNIPDFNILCAGFPCQSFSIAGKKLGFEDSKGILFFKIYQILKEKQPDAFILENVSNLVRHDRKKTFGIIISLLAKKINNIPLFLNNDENLGYNVFYKILNSKSYGVPQNRNRIYIVGFKNNVNFQFPKEFDYEVTFNDIKEDNVNDEKYMLKKTPSRFNMAKKCKKLDNNITNTLTTKQDRLSNCGLVPINNWYRFLTPLELKRLQSFPDNFKLPENLSLEQYTKLFGNSITVNIIYEIGKEMLKSLKI